MDRESNGITSTVETTGVAGLAAGIRGALEGLDIAVTCEVVVLFDDVACF